MLTGKQRGEETLIILFLGGIAAVCITGIILLEALTGGTQSDALLTIGSLSVGALAGRIANRGRGSDTDGMSEGDDAFEIIGRAATKRLIADALRNLDG